jgi:hypothetical protein
MIANVVNVFVLVSVVLIPVAEVTVMVDSVDVVNVEVT